MKDDGDRFYKKLRFQLIVFFAIAIIPFYSKWIDGIKGGGVFLFKLIKYIFLFVFPYQEMQIDEVWTSLDGAVGFVVLWSALYFVLYKLGLFVMVQFLFPVSKWEDRKKAFNRINLFSHGKHGAAVFIKNGNQIARQSELDTKNPGVALVDLSSAIVLAQQDNAKTWYLPDEDEIASAVEKKEGINLFPWKKKKILHPYDAKGPGVVFIEKGQRIDSIINLRKQTRTSQDIVVYTRNGIKVKSRVTVVFSLSDEPEVLTVGYVDGVTPHHLKILKIKEVADDLFVEAAYDLDFDDACEILNSINNPPVASAAEAQIPAPYKFDKHRVLQAALSQARNKNHETVVWHEAPLEIATDIFRATLAEIPYDNLFGDGDSYNLYNLHAGNKGERLASQFLAKIKDNFLVRVKTRGLIAFRLIERLDDFSFTQDQINNRQSILLGKIKKYAPVTLVNEKFNYFRDRGIVVKNAMFSEIQAFEDDIQKRMIKNWMAKMENEIAISSAGYELEAIRVRNRNRALLQEEMTHLLSSMFQSTPHFDEALALRVLQAVETSVAEMSDADMQSTDLYEILKNLHDWIMFDESTPVPSDHDAENSSREQT